MRTRRTLSISVYLSILVPSQQRAGESKGWDNGSDVVNNGRGQFIFQEEGRYFRGMESLIFGASRTEMEELGEWNMSDRREGGTKSG